MRPRPFDRHISYEQLQNFNCAASVQVGEQPIRSGQSLAAGDLNCDSQRPEVRYLLYSEKMFE